MFANLKSKIKEETGSDIGKLTASWRKGAFLSRITSKDDSTSSSPATSAGSHDTSSGSVSPKLANYLKDRMGVEIDQDRLHQEYAFLLEERLKERDAMWEGKLEELRNSLASTQSEEAAAAQAIARTAQAEIAQATEARDKAEKLAADLKERLSASAYAQEKLDIITEELESSRREWTRERIELKAKLSEAELQIRNLNDELELVRASLPPAHEHYKFSEEDTISDCENNEETFERLKRENSVLTRQLQEAKLALADVKTSWSGQIAALETQVARVSRQAGEEGAERRRLERERAELLGQLEAAHDQLARTNNTLANTHAKANRLSGEVASLSQELKRLRAEAALDAEKVVELEKKVEFLRLENEELSKALEDERTLNHILKEKIDKLNRESIERLNEIQKLKHFTEELKHDLLKIGRKFEKERREKDEALMRNAHISQKIQLSQTDLREQENEITELHKRVQELESIIAQHKENQATCMLIKESEATRLQEISQLKEQVATLTESEAQLQSNVQQLETELTDKNKKIKTLDSRIADMKKTLQRELQSTKSEVNCAEEADISRRYLKHVLMRFLTARELEARQLTRALATLLRLSAQEEALLQSALPARSGLTSWFSLSPT